MSQQYENKKKNGPGEHSTADKWSHLGRVQPQATEVESNILGALMLEKDAFDEVSGILKPECFYTDTNQVIYKAMQSLSNTKQPIDVSTVVGELQKMGKLDDIGGPFAIVQLTKGIVSAANIRAHARIVFEKFLKRELIRVTADLNVSAYDDTQDAFELIDRAEQTISEIGVKNLSDGMTSMSKVMSDAINKIEEFRKIEGHVTGVPTGFPRLDRATRGWQPGDLIILGARPSIGKTAFALQLIKNAAKNDIKPVTVGIWSLEMKALYLGMRMISSASEKNLYDLQIGRISDEEMLGLRRLVGELANLPVQFDDSSKITIQSLIRKARRMKKKDGLGLIVIDYLQLMEGSAKKGNREREIADLSRNLKELAQELDIPIIALSQLSRDMGSKNVTWELGPPVSALRESGAVEQDADVIMMLWGPSDEDKAKNPHLTDQRKARIAKQRNGILLTETMHFQSEIQVFRSIDDDALPAKENWKPVAEVLKEHLPVKSYYEVDRDEPEDLPF